MIGSRLGPYEITAKLGEGGMGEVYRATDARLGREVALAQSARGEPPRQARRLPRRSAPAMIFYRQGPRSARPSLHNISCFGRRGEFL